MLPRTCLAILFFVASCATAHGGPPTVEEGRRRHAAPDSSSLLSEGVLQLSRSATQALNDDVTSPPASNSYSHQRLLGPRKRLGEPQVQLESTDAHSAFASTDCSGWLSFALNTVSPLHGAVLQSQRRLDAHNRVYSEDFALRESRRPWSRAFVVAQYLRSDHAKETGFEPVTNFQRLEPGDIGAYAMGRYAKPSDESRPKPRDTGHVFIVAGPPIVVDPATKGYDARGSLHDEAVTVIAVPVIDSSATVHFEPDSRRSEEGRYLPPRRRPHVRARAGGVGTGTVWFALNEEGRVLQRRLGPQQRYRPVLARAARLRGRISLDEPVLDGGDALLVRVFEHSPSEFDGVTYGDTPVHLTGPGGLRLANGRIVLRGQNDFSGGVTVQSADLIAASPTALGVGNVVVRGGSMTLQRARNRGHRLSPRRGGPARRGDSSRFPRPRRRSSPSTRRPLAPLWDLGRARVQSHVRRFGVLRFGHSRAHRPTPRGVRTQFRRYPKTTLEEACVVHVAHRPALSATTSADPFQIEPRS